MRGNSWRDEPRCPSLDALALIEVPHWGFDGRELRGELVVAREVSGDLAAVFATLYKERFPIERMERIDRFDSDDDRSMAANNSSGFCFREIAIGGGLSRHALGLAIDINPVQNPYVVGDQVFPPAARAFLDRSQVRPGMIVRPSVVVEAFSAIGWEWGGDWTTRSDYHHFYQPDPE